MRKALTAVAAGLVLVGCGTKIEAGDKEIADTFFDSKSQSSQDVLCEGLQTAAGRKEGVDAVSESLGAPTAEDMLIAGSGSGQAKQEALDKVTNGITNGKAITQRAEAIVAYLKNDRC